LDERPVVKRQVIRNLFVKSIQARIVMATIQEIQNRRNTMTIKSSQQTAAQLLLLSLEQQNVKYT
jgi:hypothetical protein